MLDINGLSSRYAVRLMSDADADAILALCAQNTQYYEYCGKEPTRELVLSDLHITPPGIDASAKYFLGFYEGDLIVAVMDLIDGYPGDETCYIGFFMVNKQLQGKQLGSGIIQELCGSLKDAGFTSVQLAIDKGNPQSTHFWLKNGFVVTREVEQDEGILLVAERTI